MSPTPATGQRDPSRDQQAKWTFRITIAQRYGLDVQAKRVTACARDSANPSKQCPDMLQPAANHQR